jgi:hypothetical protein
MVTVAAVVSFKKQSFSDHGRPRRKRESVDTDDLASKGSQQHLEDSDGSNHIALIRLLLSRVLQSVPQRGAVIQYASQSIQGVSDTGDRVVLAARARNRASQDSDTCRSIGCGCVAALLVAQMNYEAASVSGSRARYPRDVCVCRR